MVNTSALSGTTLARKLGISQGDLVLLIDAPGDYAELVAPLPAGVQFTQKPTRNVDIAHLFVVRRSILGRHLRQLRRSLDVQAVVWVSWPKKAAGVPTDITDNTIREVALPLGFVDVKVCAVTQVWPGLKLVVRKELR